MHFLTLVRTSVGELGVFVVLFMTVMLGFALTGMMLFGSGSRAWYVTLPALCVQCSAVLCSAVLCRAVPSRAVQCSGCVSLLLLRYSIPSSFSSLARVLLRQVASVCCSRQCDGVLCNTRSVAMQQSALLHI